MWPFSSSSSSGDKAASKVASDTISNEDKPSQPTDKPRCPVDHAKQKKAAAANELEQLPAISGCPVDHGTRTAYMEHLQKEQPVNPLNQMPELSQEPAADQSIQLSTERTLSSIPRSDGVENWEYPSPQQFYHALRRRGKDAPEQHVDTMLDIHNFLNEACWEQVLYWESLHADPKARFFGWFGAPEPFDRHDWTVDRCGRQIRYVLDYYAAPSDESGYPTFSVDVRPAADSFENVWDRVRMGMREFREYWAPKETPSAPVTGVERSESV
ncbi:cytochrome c/c1 heme lyase-domain-containing protein [Syncephalis fuscata]|nr:cytochrome c/c1 heme lyase-domain-containing protein [Syncephalis fuscata]